MEKKGLGLMDSFRSRFEIESDDEKARDSNNWNYTFEAQNSLIIELLLDLREGLHAIHDKIPHS